MHFFHRWNYHRKHLRTCRICHLHQEYDSHLLSWTPRTCKEYNMAIDYWIKWEKVHNYDIADDCKYPGTQEIPPKPWPIYIEKDSNCIDHPIEERPTEIPGRLVKCCANCGRMDNTHCKECWNVKLDGWIPRKPNGGGIYTILPCGQDICPTGEHRGHGCQGCALNIGVRWKP